jgi:hypothetical protein
MNSHPSRFPWTAAVCITPVVLMWAGYFVYGMYPLGSSSFYADIFAMLMPLPALLLVVSLGFVWIAEKLGAPSLNQRTLYRMTARARLPIAFAIGGMLTLPYAFTLGTRAGGHTGLSMQPVHDLKHSAAVARIAVSAQQSSLPEAEWPASLAEWKTPVLHIEIIPHPGRDPEIQVTCGHRGSRFHRVIISPMSDPSNDADMENQYLLWGGDVWLARSLGD